MDYIKDFFAERYIDTITYIDVQDYRQWRIKKVKASTVNRDHVIITNMFYLLKRWNDMGVIKPITLPKYNPGSLVKKADERPFARKRVLSAKEIGGLLAVGPLNVRRIVLMALNTALRRKDLVNLTQGHVNRATGCLEGVQAKTGKPYQIPINSTVAMLIKTASGDRILDFTNFRRDFETALKKAGLEGVQFRDLRRTAARMLLGQGNVDIATVSSYLGHASIAMTQFYVQPENKDKRKASQFLGRITHTY